MDHYIIEEIPEELVEKYNIGKERVFTVSTGGIELKYPPIMKTPFTNYEIFEMEGKFYVRIPRIRNGVDIGVGL